MSVLREIRRESIRGPSFISLDRSVSDTVGSKLAGVFFVI